MTVILVVIVAFIVIELIVMLLAGRAIRRGDEPLPASAGVPTGGELAETALRRARVTDVRVVDGDVDAYLIGSRTIQLADGRLERSSLSAASIAAHEAAHALQHASGWRVFRIGSALLIPAAIALWLALALIVVIVAFDVRWLASVVIALVLFEAIAATFTSVIEVDASRLAMASLRDLDSELDLRRARRLLVLCGLTYVLETVSDIGYVGRVLSRDDEVSPRWGSGVRGGSADASDSSGCGGGCAGGGD